MHAFENEFEFEQMPKAARRNCFQSKRDYCTNSHVYKALIMQGELCKRRKVFNLSLHRFLEQ